MKNNKVVLFWLMLISVVSCNMMETQVEDVDLRKDVLKQYRIPQGGEKINQEEAIKVAQMFCTKKGIRTKGKLDNSVESVYSIDNSRGNPAMYAVNFKENGGFIIVSASKKFYPVLAYIEKGHYSPNRKVSGMDIWINQQKALIDCAETAPLDSLKEIVAFWSEYEHLSKSNISTKAAGEEEELTFRTEAIQEWEAEGFECMDLEASAMYLDPVVYNLWCELAQEQSDANFNYMKTAVVLYYATETITKIGPLLSTTWGQEYPYNARLKKINGQYPLAGCSIVAMAQIMRYHERPSFYNWSSMSNTTGTDATAILYRNLGRDAQTKYGIDRSTTNINNLKKAITGNKYHYRYKASVVSHLLSKTRDNINNHLPVFMQGLETSSNSAHAWVCDGKKDYNRRVTLILMVYTPGGKYLQAENGGMYSYSNSSEYYYMNWGEDGAANGWFYGDNVAYSGVLYNTLVQFNFSANRKDMVDITPENRVSSTFR